MDVSWIIPTYRDELRIEQTLRDVDRHLLSLSLPGGHEIVVVSSTAGDRTPTIVEQLARDMPAVRLLKVEGHGKGSSVRHGMLAATGAIRVFSDADNATAPAHFDLTMPLFRRGLQVVVGSRSPRDAAGACRNVDESPLRRVCGTLGNVYVRLATGTRLRDTQNGFKAFTAAAADDLFNRLTIAGFAFDVEILLLARLREYGIGAIPVDWRHDPHTSVTPAAYAEVMRDVTLMGLNRLTGKYRDVHGH